MQYCLKTSKTNLSIKACTGDQSKSVNLEIATYRTNELYNTKSILYKVGIVYLIFKYEKAVKWAFYNML